MTFFWDKLAYAPLGMYKDKQRKNRIYNEMWMSDWWWNTQVWMITIVWHNIWHLTRPRISCNLVQWLHLSFFHLTKPSFRGSVGISRHGLCTLALAILKRWSKDSQHWGPWFWSVTFQCANWNVFLIKIGQSKVIGYSMNVCALSWNLSSRPERKALICHVQMALSDGSSPSCLPTLLITQSNVLLLVVERMPVHNVRFLQKNEENIFILSCAILRRCFEHLWRNLMEKTLRSLLAKTFDQLIHSWRTYPTVISSRQWPLTFYISFTKVSSRTILSAGQHKQWMVTQQRLTDNFALWHPIPPCSTSRKE